MHEQVKCVHLRFDKYKSRWIWALSIFTSSKSSVLIPMPYFDGNHQMLLKKLKETVSSYRPDLGFLQWSVSSRQACQHLHNAQKVAPPLGWSCRENARRASSKARALRRTVAQSSRGGQKKRFKDTLKASLKDLSIDHNSWDTCPRLVWSTGVEDWCGALVWN